jgi:hypothetical protein
MESSSKNGETTSLRVAMSTSWQAELNFSARISSILRMYALPPRAHSAAPLTAAARPTIRLPIPTPPRPTLQLTQKKPRSDCSLQLNLWLVRSLIAVVSSTSNSPICQAEYHDKLNELLEDLNKHTNASYAKVLSRSSC